MKPKFIIRNMAHAALMASALLGAHSCTADFDPLSDEILTHRYLDGFEFKTSRTTDITVRYDDLGFGDGVTTSVYFELYTENPLTTNAEGESVLNPDVKPIYAACTDNSGKWSGQLDLPAYATVLYAYSPGALALDLIHEKIDGTSVTLSDVAERRKNALSTRTASDGVNYTFVGYEISITADGTTFYWVNPDKEDSKYITLHDKYKDKFIFIKDPEGNIVSVYSQLRGKFITKDELTTQASWSKGQLILDEVTDGEGTRLGYRMKWNNDSQYIGVYTNNTNYTTDPSVESTDIYKATAFTHGSYQYTMISDQATNCSADVWTLKDAGVSHDERIALQKLLGFEAYCNAVSYALDPSASNNSWSNTIGTPWKTWLGTYNSHHQIDAAGQHHNGQIDYGYKKTYSDDKLGVTPEYAATLLALHQDVINVNVPCPEEYRTTSGDIQVETEGEVAISLLGGQTIWSNSLAYYYYEEDKPVPNNRSQIHPILIAPNTQDNNGGRTDLTKGLDRGTTVQLYYYGDSDNMQESAKTATFPAKCRIGFILKGHAWNDGNPQNASTDSPLKIKECNFQLNDSKHHFSTTTPGLQLNLTAGITGSGAAMYSPIGNTAVLSFEDHNEDQNFSDVVFVLTTSSVFSNVPTISEETVKTTETVLGIYAFEDLWPSKGDFDINDVVVDVKKETTIGTKIRRKDDVIIKSQNYLKQEVYELKTTENHADYTNGLAIHWQPSNNLTSEQLSAVQFSLTINGNSAAIDHVENDRTGNGKTIFITSNVKKYIRQPYRITVTYPEATYNEPADTYENVVETGCQSNIEVFIYRWLEKGAKTWEMHLTNQAPSPLFDTSLFNTADDASIPTQGKYFVRSFNYAENDINDLLYPFGIYLSGVSLFNDDGTYKVLGNLLESTNEGKLIHQVFPNYLNWVKSGGKQNTDWYK